jgi:hypothetical protein
MATTFPETMATAVTTGATVPKYVTTSYAVTGTTTTTTVVVAGVVAGVAVVVLTVVRQAESYGRRVRRGALVLETMLAAMITMTRCWWYRRLPIS